MELVELRLLALARRQLRAAGFTCGMGVTMMVTQALIMALRFSLLHRGRLIYIATVPRKWMVHQMLLLPLVEKQQQGLITALVVNNCARGRRLG